jgi:hypothetical protein
MRQEAVMKTSLCVLGVLLVAAMAPAACNVVLDDFVAGHFWLEDYDWERYPLLYGGPAACTPATDGLLGERRVEGWVIDVGADTFATMATQIDDGLIWATYGWGLLSVEWIFPEPLNLSCDGIAPRFELDVDHDGNDGWAYLHVHDATCAREVAQIHTNSESGFHTLVWPFEMFEVVDLSAVTRIELIYAGPEYVDAMIRELRTASFGGAGMKGARFLPGAPAAQADAE